MVTRQQAVAKGDQLPGMKNYLASADSSLQCEKSSITTLGVLPESADNLGSLKTILDSLHDLYGVGTSQVTHTVVGDQKLHSAMHRLKRQYGADLDWLQPYPGDWHTLKNVQPVLIKLYHHAGLRQLASEAGYKGNNLTGLESCSHFKHTHVFLLEIFESLYLHALGLYMGETMLTFQPGMGFWSICKA